MYGKSRQSSILEPSFYYAMLAAACFGRTVGTCHPNAVGVLHDIGRKYLAEAGSGAVHEQISQFSLAPVKGACARAPWRQPWSVS